MHSIDDLLYLMARLREPHFGCPWDQKQTLATIVPYTLEEAYEVADAIEREDWQHLPGELGDLLFQVIFYAQIAVEEERFSFAQIVDQLVAKLIRRHPHVFPDGTLQSKNTTPVCEQEINRQWERIKAQERKDVGKSAWLDDVPVTLPGLSRAKKLQHRAAQVGFDWDDTELVVAAVHEELQEVTEAAATGQRDAIEEEVGDLLFTVVNLARHLKVDPEMALRRANHKFERRFGYIEQQLDVDGDSLNQASLERMDGLWNEAKKAGL